MGSLQSADTFHFFNGLDGDDSAYILLDSSDTGVTLPDDFGGELSISAHNILIYAENVTLTKNLELSGKNVTLACSQLKVESPGLSIDVSGTAGEAVIAVAQGSGLTGKAGQPAGDISLYIERLDASDATELTLKANGGDGGTGGDTSDSLNSGGVGGDGGMAGNVTFLWGSAPGRALVALQACLGLPWGLVCAQMPSITSKVATIIEPADMDAWNLLVARYTLLVTSASSCAASVDALQSRGLGSDPELSQRLSLLQRQLAELMSLQSGPDILDDSMSMGLQTVATTASQVLQQSQTGTLPLATEALMTALNAVSLPGSDCQNNALRNGLENLGQLVVPKFMLLQNTMTSLCQVKEGTGGVGGRGSSSGSNGSRGNQGAPGTVLAEELAFNGRPEDCNIATVYAFPDQCQMLLNKANGLFFQNTAQSVQGAATLYNRLLQRLAFVPTMFATTSNLTNTKSTTIGEDPVSQSLLARTYNDLESRLKVTVSATSQLQSIYATAISLSNQISIGKDMFGHNPEWVPRLTYNYYTGDIDQMLSILKAVEDAYTSAIDNKASLPNISTGQTAATSAKETAQERITLITDENGPLASNADTIASYTPLLSAKLKELASAVSSAAAEIRASINIDPVDILNALATIAMAPSASLGVVEIGKSIYTAFTTVKNSEGVSVNMDYAISEIGQAGNSLSSLHLGFATRRDKTIAADDPGGLKLLAAADDIEKIFAEFKSAISKTTAKAMTDTLDQLKDLTLTRNNAVTAYNSTLELLRQAVADVEYYTQQETAYGDQKAASMNTALPSILLWLRRTRDNYALETMRLMNYANRAIQYWGLIKPMTLAEPGPLGSFEELTEASQSLMTSGESALNGIATSRPYSWPRNGGHGSLYQLSSAEIFTLQTPLTSPVTKDVYYSVTLMLDSSAPGADEGVNTLATGANIRLDEVRLWLIGANVDANQTGAHPITVEITQLGKETIISERRVSSTFQHDPVIMAFMFDAASLKSINDCTGDKVLSTQYMPKYYIGNGKRDAEDCVAAIGPWSAWTCEVRCAENAGLDMSNLTEAWLELGGSACPFKDAL